MPLCLFTEEEEDNVPAQVEEQRKMNQDSALPSTGNAWRGFLGKLLLVLFPFPRSLSYGSKDMYTAPQSWLVRSGYLMADKLLSPI